MDAPNLLQEIKTHIIQELTAQDSDVEVRIQRNSFGWIQLSIVTSIFIRMNQLERERIINEILGTLKLDLQQYPFANYHLFTPQEALEHTQFAPAQLPLWSELLLAPDREDVAPVLDDGKRPFVVTFYSFKGGVGRSTALAFVANLLVARGHRVVMIDFDLEAPGLSCAHPIDIPEGTTYGVLDYLYQRYLFPEQNEPKIDTCIRQIGIPARGELYLIPAGVYDEGYIHRLADLNVHALYQREANPVHQLLDDVKQALDPDIILIDAQTGFTEMGAVALLDQANLGIICFSPTKQSFAGLEWVMKAARKQRKYQGIPDLRFLLTPLTAVASQQQQERLGYTADWISRHWEIPTSMTVEELYYPVPYNANIVVLESLFTEVPSGLLDPYVAVADTISASLATL